MNSTAAAPHSPTQDLSLLEAGSPAVQKRRAQSGAPVFKTGRCSSQIKEKSCLLCQGPLRGAGACVTDALHHTPGVFRLQVCPCCGLRQTVNTPAGAELAEAYPPHYLVRALGRAGSTWRQRLLNFFVRSTDRQRADLVCGRIALTPQSRVLEVGCNNGNFLAELHRRTGCQGHGIEMDAQAALEAGRKPGLTVFRG
mgnify:FL=1